MWSFHFLYKTRDASLRCLGDVALQWKRNMDHALPRKVPETLAAGTFEVEIDYSLVAQ
jgi:hypothetical protein